MKRTEIKLSLIDDYIKIISIKNFFNNKLENINNNDLLFSTQTLDKMLENIYNNLFIKLKLNDLTLDILKKELTKNNSLFLNAQKANFSNIENIVKNIYFELSKIYNNLQTKIKQLKIAP